MAEPGPELVDWASIMDDRDLECLEWLYDAAKRLRPFGLFPSDAQVRGMLESMDSEPRELTDTVVWALACNQTNDVSSVLRPIRVGGHLGPELPELIAEMARIAEVVLSDRCSNLELWLSMGKLGHLLIVLPSTVSSEPLRLVREVCRAAGMPPPQEPADFLDALERLRDAAGLLDNPFAACVLASFAETVYLAYPNLIDSTRPALDSEADFRKAVLWIRSILHPISASANDDVWGIRVARAVSAHELMGIGYLEAIDMYKRGLLALDEVHDWLEAAAQQIQKTAPGFPEGWLLRGIGDQLWIWIAEHLIVDRRPDAALAVIRDQNYSMKSEIGQVSLPVTASAFHQTGRRAELVDLLVPLNASRLAVSTPWVRTLASLVCGRIQVEFGDRHVGLMALRGAIEVEPGTLEHTLYWRMELLVAEFELAEGHVVRALELASRVEDRVRRFLAENQESPLKEKAYLAADHARIVQAEAQLRAAQDEPGRVDDHLAASLGLITRLNSTARAFRESPDNLLARKYAVEAGLRLLESSDLTAAGVAAEAALSSLGQATLGREPTWPGVFWYWLQPWTRTWRHIAEVAFRAVLESHRRQEHPNGGDGRVSNARNTHDRRLFRSLQVLRTIGEYDSFNLLIGVRPELGLPDSQLSTLDRLHEDIRQIGARLSAVVAEYRRVETFLDQIGQGAVGPPADLAKYEARRVRLETELGALSAQYEQASLDRSTLDERTANLVIQPLGEAIDSIPSLEVVQGWLSDRKSDLDLYDEHQSRLTGNTAGWRSDAAVFELVHLSGEIGGSDDRWVGVVVTDDNLAVLDPLPRGDELSEELQRIGLGDSYVSPLAMGRLSELIVDNLPTNAIRKRRLFFAPDREAWQVPFRSLYKPRWSFVPRSRANWSLRVRKLTLQPFRNRLDSKETAVVASTSHLVTLLRRARHRHIGPQEAHPGVAVGSSGNEEDRLPCGALVASLAADPFTGNLPPAWHCQIGESGAPSGSPHGRPHWMEDRRASMFVANWHTEIVDNRHTIAEFVFNDQRIPLSRWISQNRLESVGALIASCNPLRQVSIEGEPPRTSEDVSTVASSMMRSLGAESIISPTHEIAAAASVFLSWHVLKELDSGSTFHAALRRSQKTIERMSSKRALKLVERIAKQISGRPGLDNVIGVIEASNGDRPFALEAQRLMLLGLPWTTLGPKEKWYNIRRLTRRLRR